MLGSKKQRTEGIRRQAQELIDQAYERGFKAGKEEFVTAGNKVADKAYQNGLDDAWECLKWIVRNRDIAVKLFGASTYDVLMDVSPSEAISKIKSYEEQKKAEQEEVKVGDEVIFNRDAPLKVIVTCVKHSGGKPLDYTVMANNGLMWDYVKPNEITKTGRHFPQIAEVLKQLQEGE